MIVAVGDLVEFDWGTERLAGEVLFVSASTVTARRYVIKSNGLVYEVWSEHITKKGA